MAFVQANVNYATQYAQELANAYPYLSHFGAIYGAGNSAKYRPVMGKTVAIPSMTVSGAVAADRDQITGTFNRNWNNAYQTVTCQQDREWSTLIDPLLNTEEPVEEKPKPKRTRKPKDSNAV